MEVTKLKLFEVKKDTNVGGKREDKLVVEEKQPSSLRTDIYDKVNQFFNESGNEEKDIEQVKQILGKDTNALSNEQVRDLISNIDFLVRSWIEEFERGIFEGKTLEEMIQIDGK